MDWKAFAALLAAIILWALTYPLTKIGVANVAPATLGFLRVLIAAVFFVFAALATRRLGEVEKVFEKNFKEIAVISASGVLFYQLTQNFGIQLTLASAAGALTGAYPLIGLFFATASLKENVKPKQIFGALIAFAGVATIFFGGQDLAALFHTKYFLGNALIVLNCVCFAVFSIYNKTLVRKHSPLAITTATYLLGAVFLLPAFLAFENAPAALALALLTPSSWLIIFFLGVFCSGVAYFLWVYALSTATVSKASAFIYLLPLFSILFSALMLEENVTAYVLAGALLIICGVVLIER